MTRSLTGGNTKTIEELSVDWKILEDVHSLYDRTVMRAIVVLDLMKIEWQVMKSGPKVGPTQEEVERFGKEKEEFHANVSRSFIQGWEAVSLALNYWLELPQQKKKRFSFEGIIYWHLNQTKCDDSVYFLAEISLRSRFDKYMALSNDEMKSLNRSMQD